MKAQRLEFRSNGQRAVDETAQFVLFSNSSGNVASVHGVSGATANVVVIAGTTFTNLLEATAVRSGAMSVQGQTPQALQATTGQFNNIALTVQPPRNFNGQLVADSILPVQFDFAVTIQGLPNAQVTNLRWRLIETDALVNDHLFRARDLSVGLNANGARVLSMSFFLFANRDREVAGFDEGSGEDGPDDIILQILDSAGNVLVQSQPLTVRVV